MESKKRRPYIKHRAVQEIFKDEPELLKKLNLAAKKNFRTPPQQLIYYTWKNIDFME